MKHDSKNKDSVEYNCVIDTAFWICGCLDGCISSYIFDCFIKEKNKGHIDYAANGFEYGYKEGDSIYEYGLF